MQLNRRNSLECHRNGPTIPAPPTYSPIAPRRNVDGSRTLAQYSESVGTWHDPGLGRPIAAPLDRCAELLGVDLPSLREAAAKVEPYLRADGTSIWSLMQLERQLRPRPTAGDGAASSTGDESRP